MRSDIEVFFRPENPIPLGALSIALRNEDCVPEVDEADQRIIDDVWNRVVVAHPSAYSTPRGRPVLTSADRTTLEYGLTSFKEYIAVSHTGAARSLSKRFYDRMRVGAVSATLVLEDDTVFVHRRSSRATHVAGFLDTSCAGLCSIRDGGIDLTRDIKEKIERELRLGPNEFSIEGVSSIHSCAAPDFSGMVDLRLRSKLTRAEFGKRVEGIFEEYECVPRSKLDEYVVAHYTEQEDMTGDGAVALLGAVDNLRFYGALRKIQETGNRVSFGPLRGS